MIRFCFALLASAGSLAVVVAAEKKADAPDKPKAKAVQKVNIQLQPAQVQVQVQVQGQGVVRMGGGTTGNVQVRTKVDPQDNIERLLLLTPQGPIVVEAAITLDGRPFRIAREKLVGEMLQAADTDGNGKPTWKEALDNPRFVPSGNIGGFMIFGAGIQGRAVIQGGAQAQRDAYTKRYDTNKNGLVDQAEARLLLAQTTGGAAFSLAASLNRSGQPDVQKVLDADNDGKLSKDELKVAETRLKSRDANDNDLLESHELGGNRGNRVVFNQGGAQVQVVVAMNGMQLTQSPPPSHLLGPAADLTTVFKALQKKYGGENGEIRAGSFPLFPKLVAEFDSNKNGRLDSGEAAGLNRTPAHVRLQVNVGKTGEPGLSIKAVAPQLGNKEAAGSKFVQEATLQLPGVTLRFSAAKNPNSELRIDYSKAAAATINRYDKNKNGQIEKKELPENKGNRRSLEQQFARWDANSDGTVTAEEIKADYERQQAPRRSRIAAAVGEQGPSLFQTLDVSGDNRLSLREMRTAGQHLLALDKNGDGQLAVEELPVRIDVTFSRGGAGAGHYVFRSTNRPGTPQKKTGGKRGPEWFTRMDRNGDGDVTLREFLGTPEQFKKIDTNGDGFIEPKEAEAAKLPATGK